MVAREGAIPPLVALSKSSSAEALVEMLRQPRSGSLRATRPAAIVAAGDTIQLPTRSGQASDPEEDTILYFFHAFTTDPGGYCPLAAP
ncbi:unnamed protein product [Triticum turgidum subsp. durum]|uniref:Uncharacterized protein n=1 Tax=Triticum turgidum subsp. durum TaxID=4567 RepID=A0A9R1QK81_TRITD|nr:unnamed protein product [Triticum turgidum subsp. durum]